MAHLKEMLVIVIEGCFVQFVDQLSNSNDSSHCIFDGHAEDALCSEAAVLVHLWVQSKQME